MESDHQATESHACPWCLKTFRTLSGRYYHARASHTGKDLTGLGFTPGLTAEVVQ
jgi:hypothetical protein